MRALFTDGYSFCHAVASITTKAKDKLKTRACSAQEVKNVISIII
jgi:hypothetical protein